MNMIIPKEWSFDKDLQIQGLPQTQKMKNDGDRMIGEYPSSIWLANIPIVKQDFG